MVLVPKPDPTTLRNLLTMEHFRPLRYHRFGDVFRTTRRGTPVYYVGHLGSVVSASAVLRARSKVLVRLARQRHRRTRHLRVQVATMRPRSPEARRRGGRQRDPSPKYITIGVHTAVLLAWMGGRSVEEIPWDDACHLDGDVNNNRLVNLTWGDRKTNAAHREQHRQERIAREAAALAEMVELERRTGSSYGF